MNEPITKDTQSSPPTETESVSVVKNGADFQKPVKNAKFLEENSPKYKALYIIKTCLLVLLSSLLLAVAVHCLIAPNDFTMGGVSGIAILLEDITDGVAQKSTVVFFINLPMLLLAFFGVKKKFALLTVGNSLLQSLWLFIFEQVHMPKVEFPDAGTKIFAAVAGGVCIGAAVALALKAGGCTGGLDILAVIIKRKTSANSVATLIATFNAVIICASFFVYNVDESFAIRLTPILLALCQIYVEKKTNDSVMNGFQSAVEFRVITDKPEEMSLALMNELSRGVTTFTVTGMFMKENHTMLVCVVSNNQINAFKRIIKRIDPESFAVLSSVSQVVGLGFYQNEN